MATYKIVRNYFNGTPRVIERGLTLEEAQAHCNDPKTRGDSGPKGPWFDGYDEE